MPNGNFPSLKRLGALLALAVLLALPAVGYAADAYPSKPVRLIIPFPPGGSNDIIGRMIATKLTDRLGKQVIADNRSGAGGVVGTEIAAKAAPDGHTLVIIAAGHAINPALYKLPYDHEKSFVPIAKMGSGPNVLTVYPGLPVGSVKEFISLAKKQPGKLVCASSGIGSFNHLGGELFKMMAGVDFKIVQFKGGGPAMIDTMGGTPRSLSARSRSRCPISSPANSRCWVSEGRIAARYSPMCPRSRRPV